MEHQKAENWCFMDLLEVFEKYDMGKLLDTYSSPKALKRKQQKMGDKREGSFTNSLLIKR